MELSSTAGAKQVHEVHVGGNATPGCSAATLGLSLAEAKSVLAGLQRHLVQTQAEEEPITKRGQGRFLAVPPTANGAERAAGGSRLAPVL